MEMLGILAEAFLSFLGMVGVAITIIAIVGMIWWLIELLHND